MEILPTGEGCGVAVRITGSRCPTREIVVNVETVHALFSTTPHAQTPQPTTTDLIVIVDSLPTKHPQRALFFLFVILVHLVIVVLQVEFKEKRCARADKPRVLGLAKEPLGIGKSSKYVPLGALHHQQGVGVSLYLVEKAFKRVSVPTN